MILKYDVAIEVTNVEKGQQTDDEMGNGGGEHPSKDHLTYTPG